MNNTVHTPYRIAVLHPQCQIRGGAIKMMLTAGCELQKHGHHVTFFCFSHAGDCFSSLHTQLHDFQVIRGWCAWLRLAWKLRTYDVILCGNPPMQFVGAMAKFFASGFGAISLGRTKSAPYVIWWHHHVPWYYRGKYDVRVKPHGSGLGRRSLNALKAWLEKTIVISQMNEHWVTSKYVGKALQDYSGVDSTVVSPVLEEAFLQRPYLDRTHARTGDSIHPIVIATHGRISAGKGFERLFSVYDRLRGKYRDLEFWIMGDGELRSTYQARYASDTCVKFLGVCSTERIIENYIQVDIAMFASEIDAFGLSALEAQALGVDTIVLDTLAGRESVVDPQVGHLVVGVEGFVEQIHHLLGGNTPKRKGIFSTQTDVYCPFFLSFFSSHLMILISKIEK